MTARLVTALAVAGLAASTLTAQQNLTQPPDGARLVLTGCVEHADELKNAVASDTTIDSLTFVLTQALPATSSTTAAAAIAVGTSGTMPRSYRLDASVEKLGTHVGQQVEITGRLAEKSTAPAGAGSAAAMPRVVVDSVKVIDPTCAR